MIKDTVKQLEKERRIIQKTYDATLIDLKKLEEELRLIDNQILLKKGKNPKYVKGVKRQDIPAKYEQGMLQKKKVIFVVHQLREASVNEISEYMLKIEKDVDSKAMYARTLQVVKILTAENKLIKIGDYAATYKLNIIDK